MFTGYQTNSANGSTFEGNIVVFENRQFTMTQVPATPPNPAYVQIDGEPVYEGVFGFSTNIQPAGLGYGVGADRTVLIRWPATQADPVITVGSWIADVTYERHAFVVWNPNTFAGRFLNGNPPIGIPNPTNKGEWDNMPAQRCFWYQVAKVAPAANATGTMVFSTDPGPYRYMIVYVSSSLQAKTLLKTINPPTVEPAVLNAVLVSPYVVNVIPQTIFVR
jgi:hypothetical protein